QVRATAAQLTKCSCAAAFDQGPTPFTGGWTHSDPASTCGRALFSVRQRTFSCGSPCRGARALRAGGHILTTFVRPKSIRVNRFRHDRSCAKPPENLVAQLHTTAVFSRQNGGKRVVIGW